jgi:hypothetical protein
MRFSACSGSASVNTCHIRVMFNWQDVVRITVDPYLLWRHQNSFVCKSEVIHVLNYLSTMPWKHMREWRHSSTVLDLGTRWKWVVSFTPLPLYTRGKRPGIQWRGGWVGPRVGLDAVEKRKILHCQKSNPGRAARSPSLHQLSYPDSTICVLQS